MGITVLYPTSTLSADGVLLPRIYAFLADTGCGAYNELETISAVQGLGCFSVNLLIDAQQ